MSVNSNLPSAEDFDRIERALFDRLTARHRRQVVRRRLVAVAAVLVVSGAGVAAATVANPHQQSNLAYCYSGSDTSSQVSQTLLPSNGAFRQTPGSKPSSSRIARAVQLCEGAWTSGIFNKTNATGPFSVPKLQVCLRDDLIVSVFRKTNTGESARAFCENLGQSAP